MNPGVARIGLIPFQAGAAFLGRHCRVLTSLKQRSHSIGFAMDATTAEGVTGSVGVLSAAAPGDAGFERVWPSIWRIWDANVNEGREFNGATQRPFFGPRAMQYGHPIHQPRYLGTWAGVRCRRFRSLKTRISADTEVPMRQFQALFKV